MKAMCFQKELSEDYKKSIKEFEASYKLLGISITPKVHAVLDHIEDFFEQQNDVLGLGYHSEQASEAVQRDFTKLWSGSKNKREINHKDYPKNLLKCVVVYNSRHQ